MYTNHAKGYVYFFRFNTEDKLLQAIASYDTEIGQLHEFKENLKCDLSCLKQNYEDVKVTIKDKQ